MTGSSKTQHFLDEEVRPRSQVLIVFYQRHPHWTGLLVYCNAGKLLFNFDYIWLRLHRPMSCQDANLVGLSVVSDNFRGWPDYTKYPFRWCECREIFLLNCSQGLRRSCVAGQDHQVASLVEKPLNTFECVMINRVEWTVTVRCPGVIPQVEIIVLWKFFRISFITVSPPYPESNMPIGSVSCMCKNIK